MVSFRPGQTRELGAHKGSMDRKCRDILFGTGNGILGLLALDDDSGLSVPPRCPASCSR